MGKCGLCSRCNSRQRGKKQPFFLHLLFFLHKKCDFSPHPVSDGYPMFFPHKFPTLILKILLFFFFGIVASSLSSNVFVVLFIYIFTPSVISHHTGKNRKPPRKKNKHIFWIIIIIFFFKS